MPAASFMPELLKKVITGDKTQTRRLCLPGQQCKVDDNGAITHILSAKLVTQWQTGRAYAVKAGRVSPGVLWSPTRGIVTDYRTVYRNIFGKDAPNWSPKMLRFCLTEGTDLVAVTIKVTGLRVQDVRKISNADALAEGFATPLDFLATWTSMHDKSHQFQRIDATTFHIDNYGIWETRSETGIKSILRGAPANRYEANAITFEVQKGQS